MAKKVKNMGAEIIQGKGKTYYGISTCVCYLADAILNKRSTVASVTSILSGTMGLNNVALSLPCLIDHKGIKQILPLSISKEEKNKLIETNNKLSDIIHNMYKNI